ncbi:hypothetical protein Tco_0192659, partial [Tanacetum coccineum]
EDSDPFMEEIDIFLASNDSTPPGFESDYDSEGDILLLEELLNDDLVPLAEYNHFTFDIEPDTSVKNDFDELNEDECFDPRGGKNVVFLNVEEDDSFTFTIRTFLPFVTYPEVSPLLSSTKNEDTIFDPDISTKSRWPLIEIELSYALMFVQTLMKGRLKFSLPFALPKDELIQGSSRTCDSVTKNKPLRGSSPHAYLFSLFFLFSKVL